MKKLKLAELKKTNALSRNEMREILAGTGGFGICGWCTSHWGGIMGCIDSSFPMCVCPSQIDGCRTN